MYATSTIFFKSRLGAHDNLMRHFQWAVEDEGSDPHKTYHATAIYEPLGQSDNWTLSFKLHSSWPEYWLGTGLFHWERQAKGCIASSALFEIPPCKASSIFSEMILQEIRTLMSREVEVFQCLVRSCLSDSGPCNSTPSSPN